MLVTYYWLLMAVEEKNTFQVVRTYCSVYKLTTTDFNQSSIAVCQGFDACSMPQNINTELLQRVTVKSNTTVKGFVLIGLTTLTEF